jgi:3-hydroxy-9,10-secoandrosta-1,3,5(10)-triene-9,17-dione monooxygenase
MAVETRVGRPCVYPTPEPELTPQRLIDRAVAMRPMLLEQQEDADDRGYYSATVHEAFKQAGFYRCLQPRLFGGYEFDVPTFFRMIVEIARGGGGGTGWCAATASSHALVVGTFWSERAQREVFGKERGHFAAPHRVQPGGTARRVEGGYLVNGRWAYSSGVPHATHFLGGAMVVEGDAPVTRGDGTPVGLTICVPSEQYTVLDDWGGHSPTAALGLQGSGSNTVVIRDQVVPEHFALCDDDWRAVDRAMETPGVRLHGNPMYMGRHRGFYHGELVSVQVGTARAALDEYERLLLTTPSATEPGTFRYELAAFQEPFGLALAMVDAAEHILLHVGQTHMAYCQRWARTGQPYTHEDDLRLHGALQQAGRLCFRAVELLLRTAGPRMANNGSRLQRYFRDITMYRVHESSHEYLLTPGIARAHFGLPVRQLDAR